MAVNTKDILVGVPDRVTGAAKTAALGTALPVGVTASDAAFTDCGYISDAGVQVANTLNTVTVHDWGGDIVRSFVQTTDGKVSLTFLETNTTTAQVMWGAANVTVTAPTGSTGNVLAVSVNGLDPDHKAWVFNVKDGVRKKRICIPDAQVLMRGPISYVKSGVASFQVDLTVYPDSAGNLWYEYSDDGVITGVSIPVITSITPASRGAGMVVNIAGNGFTGATAVTFNAVAATSYLVNNDNSISAVLPAGSAGVTPVIVTNAQGASAAVNYTRIT